MKTFIPCPTCGIFYELPYVNFGILSGIERKPVCSEMWHV